jgi:hypothetical protein
VNTADAFHQRRFAGAIIAQQSQHLAAKGIDADIFQCMDGAEVLLRMADREHWCHGSRSHWILAA